MRQAVLLADLHLHPTPLWRFEWLVSFVDTLLEQQHTIYKGFDLYLLGDVTEARDNVDSRVLNLLIKLIANWKTGEVIWITGQHDSYLPGRATLEALEHTGTVKIVDREIFYHKKNDIWFVPFARQESDYRDMLAKVPDGATLMTHMPTVEIMEMFGAKGVKGISVKEFDRFKHSYSGDIHVFHDFPKFSYIGAPSQRDWRDKGVVGQIGTLVGDEFKRTPIKHPVHLEVENESEIPKDVQCILRVARGVISAGNINVLAATTTVELKPQSVKLGSVSQESVITDYVSKNKPEGIDPDDLSAYARETLKEAEMGNTR